MFIASGTRHGRPFRDKPAEARKSVLGIGERSVGRSIERREEHWCGRKEEEEGAGEKQNKRGKPLAIFH